MFSTIRTPVLAVETMLKSVDCALFRYVNNPLSFLISTVYNNRDFIRLMVQLKIPIFSYNFLYIFN